MMLVLGALSSLAAVGFLFFSDVETAASKTKIQSDIATLNNAVTMYTASGGSLKSASSPHQVLAKLKTERTSGSAQTAVVPLTGAMIDRRLVADMQSVQEAASTQPRAYWNEIEGLFEIRTSGVVGVKRFRLDPSLSDAQIITEARSRDFYAFNSQSGWVWNTAGTDSSNDAQGVWAPSVVDRQPFPEAPAVTAPPIINSAIVSGAEAPGVDLTGGSPTHAASTVVSPDMTTAVVASAADSGTESAASTAEVTTAEVAEAFVEASPGFVGGGLTGILESLQGALAISGDTNSSDWSDGSGPERLPRPVLDNPGGGYLKKDFPLKVKVENLSDYKTIGSVIYRINWDEWKPYDKTILLAEDQRLSVKARSLDGEAYRDSYESVDSYYAAQHIFSGVTEGEYTDVEGGPALVYSLTENGSFLAHGRPVVVIGNDVIDGGEANSLKYMLTRFSGVTAGVPFPIGHLLYHNGTTYDDTHATSTILNIDVVFTEPYAAKELNLPLDLVNTVNTDDADASADYVVLTEPGKVFPFELDGRLYDLTIEFGAADNAGFSTPTEFHAYEGQTSRAAVMATLTDKGPKPGGSQWGDWGLQSIMDWLTNRGYF